MGTTDVEVENVIAAINCTGPNSDITRLRFKDPVGRIVGCALATADYTGLLADPHYPDKLGELYREFSESDDYANVPIEKRIFKSEEDLVCRTPDFWVHFVKPKLDNDFRSVYRFLERPFRSGHNDYLAAIEDNFAKVSRRIAAIKGAARQPRPRAHLVLRLPRNHPYNQRTSDCASCLPRSRRGAIRRQDNFRVGSSMVRAVAFLSNWFWVRVPASPPL